MRTAAPESAGVPSSAIAAFLNKLAGHRVNLHSVLLLRSGVLHRRELRAAFPS